MLIEYVGHACFYLVNKNGVRIIIDPYDNSIGLAPVSKEADIALITHHHYDHDYIAAVSGDYVLIDKAGSYQEKGVSIFGVELPHDDAGGSKRGMVVAYRLETEGMRLLHMSDVGVVPDDSFFEEMGRIDILMLPIGGTYTVDAEGALEIMDRMNPNITIPMHYKTTHLKLDVESPHRFVKLAKKNYDVSYLGDSELEITADNLKKRGRIFLMENSY